MLPRRRSVTYYMYMWVEIGVNADFSSTKFHLMNVLKVNEFAVLVDCHKKVFRKVNIDRLESGPIREYVFLGIGGKIQTA
jgi:hypothetical protein